MRQMGRGQREQAGLGVDRRRVVVGQRREDRREALGRDQEDDQQREAAEPQRRSAASGSRPASARQDAVERDAAQRAARRRRPAGRSRPDQTSSASASRSDVSAGTARAVGGSRAPARRRPSSARAGDRRGRPCRSAAPRTRRRGRAMISAGLAYCSSRPWLITAIRSPRRNASSMSWVTRTMVVLKRRWIARRSSCALAADDRRPARRTARPSAGVGLGRERAGDADALLLAAGELVRELAARTRRGRAGRASAARRPGRRSCAFGQPSRPGTVAMFSATVRCGNRPWPWMA